MKKYVGVIATIYVKLIVAVSGYYSTYEVVYPCIYRYDPTCGSDGLTYYNKCNLDWVNRENQYNGRAPVFASEGTGNCKECKCQNVNLPVCALDGTTYANECEIDCANRYRIRYGLSIIFLAYRKKCNGPPCDCPTIASPVCGTDDILYRNECVLQCASNNSIALGLPEIGLKNVGACRDGCSCPQTYQTVGDYDGRSYNNPCQLECVKERDDKNKSVETSPYRECDEYNPICASNGTTFDNKCALECENEKRYNAQLPLLTVLGKGKCISCICEAIYEPVCGTNNETYGNECLLECDSEVREQKGLQSLTVLYKGECRDPEYECYCNHCSSMYEPVCGDDYATYWNYCLMTCISDCNSKTGEKVIQLIKNEPCF